MHAQRDVLVWVYSPTWYKGLCQTSCLQLGGHRLAVLQSHCRDQLTSHTAAETKPNLKPDITFTQKKD